MTSRVSPLEFEAIADYYATHSLDRTVAHFKRSVYTVLKAAKMFNVKQPELSEEQLDAKFSTVGIPYGIDQRLWVPPLSAMKYEVTKCLR